MEKAGQTSQREGGGIESAAGVTTELKLQRLADAVSGRGVNCVFCYTFR